MKDILKLNLKIGEFSLSIEGSPNTVISQFQQIQSQGLGKLANITPNTSPSPQPHPSSQQSSSQTLQDIVLKDTPQSEAQWLVVFAHFHTQNTNSSTFTRHHLLDYYRLSKRYTRNRSKGLTDSITSAVKKGWLKAINDTDFTLTSAGQTLFQTLLS